MNVCVIEDCGNPVKVKSKQWCSAHYGRFVRHGSPHIVKRRGGQPKTQSRGASPNYRGAGRLVCNACGRKVVEHSVLETCVATKYDAYA